MTSAQILLLAGSGIGLLLGLGHGAMALADTFRPRFFAPLDARLGAAMERAEGVRLQAGLPFGTRGSVWRSWLGFHLSHSLGIVVFNSVVLAAGLGAFPWFATHRAAQSAVVGVSAAYFLLSIRFWFLAPTLGLGSAFLCFLAAALLV